MLKHRDIIQVLTTKGIKYLSAPEGQTANPNGNWIIIGFIEDDIIAAKDNTLIRVPIQDTRKVASFNTELFYKELEKVGYIDNKINIPSYISNKLGINIAEVRKLLKENNIKIITSSEYERDIITNKIMEIINDKKK